MPRRIAPRLAGEGGELAVVGGPESRSSGSAHGQQEVRSRTVASPSGVQKALGAVAGLWSAALRWCFSGGDSPQPDLLRPFRALIVPRKIGPRLAGEGGELAGPPAAFSCAHRSAKNGPVFGWRGSSRPLVGRSRGRRGARTGSRRSGRGPSPLHLGCRGLLVLRLGCGRRCLDGAFRAAIVLDRTSCGLFVRSSCRGRLPRGGLARVVVIRLGCCGSMWAQSVGSAGWSTTWSTGRAKGSGGRGPTLASAGWSTWATGAGRRGLEAGADVSFSQLFHVEHCGPGRSSDRGLTLALARGSMWNTEDRGEKVRASAVRGPARCSTWNAGGRGEGVCSLRSCQVFHVERRGRGAGRLQSEALQGVPRGTLRAGVRGLRDSEVRHIWNPWATTSSRLALAVRSASRPMSHAKAEAPQRLRASSSVTSVASPPRGHPSPNDERTQRRQEVRSRTIAARKAPSKPSRLQPRRSTKSLLHSRWRGDGPRADLLPPVRAARRPRRSSPTTARCPPRTPGSTAPPSQTHSPSRAHSSPSGEAHPRDPIEAHEPLRAPTRAMTRRRQSEAEQFFAAP
ncbi:hypothetical protein ENSA5_14360 [Enhygromyxa salina]|uniref:Uncharacterized protein n=1 Tax=Enhygromyxa salina TaxID=215803 RepID=A0A2S9YEV0_9BACT|nr:hypothetical protein ENSA5_14360 [Enhygromyxa salina]